MKTLHIATMLLCSLVSTGARATVSVDVGRSAAVMVAQLERYVATINDHVDRQQHRLAIIAKVRAGRLGEAARVAPRRHAHHERLFNSLAHTMDRLIALVYEQPQAIDGRGLDKWYGVLSAFAELSAAIDGYGSDLDRDDDSGAGRGDGDDGGRHADDDGGRR